jgi:nucleotide-binding universal stress UspA family protein
MLLAVDDSKSARVAASVMKVMQPPVHLLVLHVVDVARYQHPSMPPRLSRDYYGRVRDCLVDLAYHLLEEIKASLPQDLKSIETSVVVGDPVKTILETAKRYNPDLLVLGSRDLGYVQEWLVGSVSYHVASQASCPVLVIKRPIKKLRKVLLGYDGSDDADRAADFLAREVFREPVEVTIATVWPKPPALPPAIKADAKFFLETVKAAAAELGEKVRQHLPATRYKTSTEVVEGEPGKVLVRLATERESDLVIVGSRGLSRVKRVFLGSVSHTILHKAPCAVLVVKGQDVHQEEKMPASGKKARDGEKERSPDEWRDCLICGKPAGESICEHCKIIVQAEALAQKRKIEKGGGG